MTWVDSIPVGRKRYLFPAKAVWFMGLRGPESLKETQTLNAGSGDPVWLEFCLQLKMDPKNKELDQNIAFLQSWLGT